MNGMTTTFKKIIGATLLSSVAVFGAQAEQTQSSVWKVSKGEDTVLVGGTVHILPVSEFPLPSQFDAAYKLADAVVLETKLPDPTDQQAQLKLMQGMMYNNGENIKQHISPETVARLTDYFASIGGNFEQMAGFRPGPLASVIVMMEAQRAGIAGQGVDAYYSQIAQRDQKPLEYLESLDFQLELMAKMGQGEEDFMLNQNLDYVPKVGDLIKDMIAAWRVGDTKVLNELALVKMKQDSPKSYDAMMTQRNIDWVPKIEAMFGDDDKELVLVGVGHLVGEDSVLKMLEEKGYKVERF